MIAYLESSDRDIAFTLACFALSVSLQLKAPPNTCKELSKRALMVVRDDFAPEKANLALKR